MEFDEHIFKSLTVIVPVYNERYTIRSLLERVLAAPLPGSLQREVIVVDDGSIDGTGEILKTLEQKFAELRVCTHAKNEGKGRALHTGVAASNGDVILFQDADLEYSPEEYTRVLAPVLSGDADVVYGSRFLPYDARRVLLFWHSVANRCLTLFSNLSTGLNLSDMGTGCKLIRGDLLRSIPIRSSGFSVEAELTAKLAKRECRIYEVPVSYRGRSYQDGKKVTWKDGVAMVGAVIKYSFIDDVYDEKYGHDILYSLSRTHRFNRWMSDTIRPFVGQNVMEIGSGMGNLMQKFLPRDAYTASDIDPLHLRFLKNRYGDREHIDVQHVNINEPGSCDALAGRFDTVIALNVIEHVEDDRTAFKNIFTALQEGGRACILVPRNPKLFGTLDEVLDHYRRYVREELEEKMQEAGFEIETLFTFNRISVPAWWWNARIKKVKNFNRWQLKLFDSTIWFWRLFDRLLPWKGISLIAIGRKPETGNGNED